MGSSSTVALERRVLAAVTLSTLLGFVLWVVAVSTDFWFRVYSELPQGNYINSSSSYFVSSHSGLWTICTDARFNGSLDRVQTRCRYLQQFPSSEEIRRNPQIDGTIVHYSRTEIAFSIISAVLMVVGLGFSLYTFFEHRYMFKRLAGGFHLLNAATVLVVLQMTVNSIKYESAYLTDRHPKDTRWTYGFSFVLACVTFALLVCAGCAFIFCSRKRKGEAAAAACEMYARADEPQILGRT